LTKENIRRTLAGRVKLPNWLGFVKPSGGAACVFLPGPVSTMKFGPKIIALLLSLTLSVGLVELAYRFYLADAIEKEVAAHTARYPQRAQWVYAAPAPWRYNRDYGFDFNDGEWLAAEIENGRVSRCSAQGAGNEYGHAGAPPLNWENADFRILLLGSSYTMMPDDAGRHVGAALEASLSAATRKKIAVMNASRDATGFLSALDLAKVQVARSKPDLILLTFNITAFGYDRHWRFLKTDPDDPAISYLVFSREPEPDLNDASRLHHTANLVSATVTREWCARPAHETAPDIARYVAASIRVRQRIEGVHYNAVELFTLRHSYVLASLTSGGRPLAGVETRGQIGMNAPTGIARFQDDGQFMDAWNAIAAQGIPIVPIHLTTLIEARRFPEGGYAFGYGGVDAGRAESLARSLEQISGRPTEHLFRYYSATDRPDPRALVYSEEDSHPNPSGVAAMTRALERLARELRLVPGL